MADGGEADEGEQPIAPSEISVSPEDGWVEKGRGAGFSVYGRAERGEEGSLRAAGAMAVPVPALANRLADAASFVASWNFVGTPKPAGQGDDLLVGVLVRSPLLAPRCAQLKVSDDSARVADFGGHRVIWSSSPSSSVQGHPEAACAPMGSFSGSVTLLPADEGQKTLAVVDLRAVPGGHLPRYIVGKSARWWLEGILGAVRQGEAQVLDEMAAAAALAEGDAGMAPPAEVSDEAADAGALGGSISSPSLEDAGAPAGADGGLEMPEPLDAASDAETIQEPQDAALDAAETAPDAGISSDPAVPEDAGTAAGAEEPVSSDGGGAADGGPEDASAPDVLTLPSGDE